MKMLLADDHALFMDGLNLILNAVFPGADLHQAGSWHEVHGALTQHPVDLALVDLSMPGSWQGELPKLCQQYPRVKFCVLSATTIPEVIQAAFQLGIKGYITKLADMDEMEVALRKIMAGGIYFPQELWARQSAPSADSPSPLTRRQQDIVSLVAQGKSNKQIGSTLGISESTVKRHVFNLFQVLNVSNRIQAVTIAKQIGVLPL